MREGANPRRQSGVLARRPLHAAVGAGRLETARILLGDKSVLMDIDEADAEGATPLILAAMGG
jgi:ankyrin repeat protein